MSKQILLAWLGIADLKAESLLSNNVGEPIGDGSILGGYPGSHD
jgi:hypothetical protein